MEDMDRDSCPKIVKTWTILITQYGEANLVAKALKTFEEWRILAIHLIKLYMILLFLFFARKERLIVLINSMSGCFQKSDPIFSYI